MKAHLKDFEMHHSLYSALFFEESTSTIVSNPFDYFLVGADCDKIQAGVVLHPTVRGRNHMTHHFLETNRVD